MLDRLAHLCVHRRRFVLLAWVLLLVVLTGVGQSVKGEWLTQGELPDMESTRALRTLERQFPAFAGQGRGESGSLVFEVPATSGGLAAQKQSISDYLAEVAKVDGVTSVVSPFDAPNQISPDGTIGYAQFSFAENTKLAASADDIKDRGKALPEGVRVEYSGFPFYEFELPPSELIGMVGAVIILLIAFGSVVAAGLPLLTAIFGIGASFGLMYALTSFIGMPEFTPNLVQMIGLGIGIDYALFIVTRYRTARKTKDQAASVHEAVVTAGRAVLFAGITVVISMLGMVLLGLEFIRGMAIGISASVAVVVLAALTLVPALLSGRVGRNIDRWHVPFFAKEPEHETMWHRWSRYLQRHAWPAAIGGVVLLAAMSVPLFKLNLGVSDDGNLPTKQTTRRSYDLLAKGFGPGANGPFIVTAESNQGPDTVNQGVAALQDAMRADSNVAFVTPPVPSESGEAAFFQVFPKTAPQEEATEQLVHRLRDAVVPQAAGASSLTVHIGGNTPGNIDFSKLLGDRLPLFMTAVLALSFLLLMVVFRSILVPLKAVIMNLLSIGASYGLIVAVFQWGWLSSVFGVGRPGPIEPWIPMMLFAIVFGLSMDYEVFLLSKIREDYDRTRNNSVAVVEGLASTARVITAAAAIMVLVFAGFIPGERAIKVMGLGLASAIFIDATVVRMVLVPATMELLGERNWWFPRWLDRLVPKVSVEGPHEPVPVPVPVQARK